MATQIQFLNNKKVQVLRKGTLTDVACLYDNSKTCTWACMMCLEPVSLEGYTTLSFYCGINGRQFVVPDADFTDSR
jgi:hypothetical protein